MTVKVNVIPANTFKKNAFDLFKKAFKNNPAVEDILQVPTPYGSMVYVQFANKVVQFYADEMSDPYGYRSTLYQDIAKDAFQSVNDVVYCTAPTDYSVIGMGKDFE